MKFVEVLSTPKDLGAFFQKLHQTAYYLLNKNIRVGRQSQQTSIHNANIEINLRSGKLLLIMNSKLFIPWLVLAPFNTSALLFPYN